MVTGFGFVQSALKGGRVYQLTIYKMKTMNRWKWRFSYQNKIVARADHHYASPSKAEMAFYTFSYAVVDRKFRTRIEK
jgi:hypothetical protein